MSSKTETLRSVFMSIQGRIARHIHSIVPPKDVEDIVQETYVRVCQVKNEDDIRHPRSFLLRTAKNLALDYLKSANVRLVSSIEDEEFVDWSAKDADLDETYQAVLAKEEFSGFCEAVRRLPLQCRKVFVLKKVYGYTQKEIAQQLNISESTVEKHIALGIRRCRAYMLEHGVIEFPQMERSVKVKKASK